MVSVRTHPGFTLAEVVVSLLLICTTLSGVTAASAWAARTIRSADALEDALVRGDALLDSIVSSPRCVSGVARQGLTTIRWDVTAAATGVRAIDMRVEYVDGSMLRTLRIEHVRTRPALQPVGAAP